jgi:hypothetical protein
MNQLPARCDSSSIFPRSAVCRRALVPFLAAVLAAALAEPGAAAPRPTWECLPDDTALMVRLPNAAGFVAALRERTRFGAVVLEPRRLWQVTKLLAPRLVAGDPGNGPATSDPPDMETRLARYGLTTADLVAGLERESGIAVVIRSRPQGGQPLVLNLAWTEPGEGTAGRLVAAFHKQLEEDPVDDGEPWRRLDLRLAGHEVTQASRSLTRLDLGELNVAPDLDQAGLEALRRELAERARTAPRVSAGRIDTFMTNLAGRLIAGQAISTSDEEADESRALFERFLAAHESERPAALADLFRGAAVRDTLPSGDTLADIVVDPRAFLRALDDDEQGARLVRAAGLDQLGPVVWRHAFSDGGYRQGLVLALPAPREGLMRILDQECDPAEVPPFVTSEATDFTQISLDLGKAYATIRELVAAEGGEQVANMIGAGEMQALGWLGVDIAGLLSALGTRHWILTFPTEVAAMLDEARKTRTDDGLQTLPAADRMALVWQLTDEAPFAKLLQRLAPLAGGDVSDEQGFRGLRLPGDVGVFVGRDHAVVAVGETTAEATLTAIRHPPVGAASLRETTAVRRSRDMLAAGPTRVFSVGDASRHGGLLGLARDIASRLEPADVPPDFRGTLRELQSLLPTAAEMEGMFGVAASVVQVTRDGVTYRSAWEMPAP